MKRLLLLLLLAGCQAEPVAINNVPADPRSAMRAFSPLPPLPPDKGNAVQDDERAARLGQRLFFDPGYAKNGKVSCATCHDPAKAFTDGLPQGHGLGGGNRNTPTVLLAAFQRWQGWGGRGDSLWTQAIAALTNPSEMGATTQSAAKHLLATEAEAYREVFGPGHEAESEVVANLGKAMGAYMRKLVPGPAAFDRYVAGDDTAMDARAVRGFGLFTGKAGCAVCHSGPLFSDGDFHNIGVPQSRGTQDHGRRDDLIKLGKDAFRAGEVPAADANDDGRFRTPGLRDVSLTPPYWHAGNFVSLEAVLDFDLAGGGKPLDHFFPGQQDEKLKPVALDEGEREALVAFLNALEMGPVPGDWATAPSPRN
jgi:cytochrome c peroxidase